MAPSASWIRPHRNAPLTTHCPSYYRPPRQRHYPKPPAPVWNRHHLLTSPRADPVHHEIREKTPNRLPSGATDQFYTRIKNGAPFRVFSYPPTTTRSAGRWTGGRIVPTHLTYHHRHPGLLVHGPFDRAMRLSWLKVSWDLLIHHQPRIRLRYLRHQTRMKLDLMRHGPSP